MIPKICHLYWDRSPMAFLQVLTVISFHKHNPDWRMVIYLTKQPLMEQGRNTFVPDYTGKDYFHIVTRLDYVDIQIIDMIEWGVPLDAHSCQGSDLFRRNVLYRYGGVYSDFDMLWLKPISELKNVDCIGNSEDFECIVSFYGLTHGFHNVSNLIAEPGSKFIYSLIEEQRKIKPPYPHQAFGSSMLNNKYPDLKSVTDKFPRILAIPYETFYPYSTYNMGQLFEQNDLSVLNKNVLGIHWFNGNAISKKYINEEKYPDCSMTTILKNEKYI